MPHRLTGLIRQALADEARQDWPAAAGTWWQAWHVAELDLQDPTFAAYCAENVKQAVHHVRSVLDRGMES